MSGIEEPAVGEWSIGLAGLTGDQIALGLEAWQEEWPPSLPQFRKACLGKHRKDESGGDRHYCPTFNGPVMEKITDRSRLLSSDDRDARRAKARDVLGALKAKMRGGNTNAAA